MSYAQAARKLRDMRSLRLAPKLVFFFFVAAALLSAMLLVWPNFDIAVSGWFYRPEGGFYMRDYPFFEGLRFAAHAGSRIMGFAFLLLSILAASQRRTILGLGAKPWLFLFLGLLLGPGLVANAIFKDHWGRARPRDIVEFAGTSQFTPALVPAAECHRNCSFVSGDGAFGFFLPAFAYVVPISRSRRLFWLGMGLGGVFSVARLLSGAHFLSDILFAGLFVQLVLVLLSRLMFSPEETRRRWRRWMFLPNESRN
ncbi:MAG: phosphatase PAP2 family protein [Bdellovibrionales bacterium]